MEGHLFAGIAVSDFARAVGGTSGCSAHRRRSGPTTPSTSGPWPKTARSTSCASPGSAGHGLLMVMLDDLDAFVSDAATRGIEPEAVETYEGGVRKAVFRDPDGNEVGFGGMPA